MCSANNILLKLIDVTADEKSSWELLLQSMAMSFAEALQRIHTHSYALRESSGFSVGRSYSG